MRRLISASMMIAFLLLPGPREIRGAEKEAGHRCEKGSLYAVQLIFGLSSEDGKGVSEQQWDRFVKTSISGRFTGSTAVDGVGRYNDNARRKEVIEKAKIVTLVIECNEASESALRKTVEEYRQQFGQQSVLRIDSFGQAMFYEEKPAARPTEEGLK